MRGLRNDVAAPPQQLGAVLVCCVLLASAFWAATLSLHSLSAFTEFPISLDE
jgi:hypothetical protein